MTGRPPGASGLRRPEHFFNFEMLRSFLYIIGGKKNMIFATARRADA
jgi:hypothetical protein